MTKIDDELGSTRWSLIGRLKNWDDRGRGENLEHIHQNLAKQLATVQEARTRLLVPPPIQGLGASSGFQMQVELTDGSYDFARLQSATDQIVREANATPHRLVWQFPSAVG